MTHYRICAWKFEVPRLKLDKKGFIEIWLAKCYDNNGLFEEIPGLEGVYIKLEDEVFDNLTKVSTKKDALMDGSLEAIAQYLIDKKYIDGEIVE